MKLSDHSCLGEKLAIMLAGHKNCGAMWGCSPTSCRVDKDGWEGASIC